MKEYHPIASLFPMMRGEEYEALKKDIADNGQLEPIWLHPDGRIIDGRNRYRVCTELGIEPHCRTWSGEGSLVAFILSMNLHRRHLTPSQRAMVAVDILPMLEAEARVRMLAGRPCGNLATGSDDTGKARDHAAKLVQTGSRYVSDAKAIQDKAPALAEQVRAGEMNIPEAKREIARQEREAKRQEIEQAGQDTYIEQAPMRVCYGDMYRMGRHRIICGDCGDPAILARALGHNTIHMLLNDPPYGMSLDTDYSKMPSTKLEGNRTYAAIIGDDRPFTYNNFGISAEEEFWFGADYYRKSIPDGGSWLVWDKRVEDKFDAMIGSAFELIWSREPHKREIIRCNNTLFSGEAEAKNKWHPTAKPSKVIAWIVSHYSQPDDVIMDMYLGSGTTLMVCQRLERTCLGIELSPDYVALTLQRFKDETGIEPEKLP